MLVDKKDYDSYTLKDKLGKITLLFFIGLYFLFVFEPLNWTGMIISGIFMFASFIFVLHNDYKNNMTRFREKLIGLMIVLLFAFIALVYTSYKYSIEIF